MLKFTVCVCVYVGAASRTALWPGSESGTSWALEDHGKASRPPCERHRRGTMGSLVTTPSPSPIINPPPWSSSPTPPLIGCPLLSSRLLFWQDGDHPPRRGRVPFQRRRRRGGWPDLWPLTFGPFDLWPLDLLLLPAGEPAQRPAGSAGARGGSVPVQEAARRAARPCPW